MPAGLLLLCLGPDARRFAFIEEFDVDDVGVATHGAVLNVLLFSATGSVQREDDLLTAGWAYVGTLVCGSAAFLLAFLHAFGITTHNGCAPVCPFREMRSHAMLDGC
jgi:hypothetical protein